MMIRTLSYLGAAIGVIATAGTVAGCGAVGGTANAATGQPEQRTITVDSVPVADEAGLYVAQAKGFFAQQGLTVKIKSITGAETAIPDLQSGQADLVAGNYVSFILAQMAGTFDHKPISMRIIAAGSQMTPGTEDLYVMPHSKYQTVAALAKAHGTVGVNTANNVGDVVVGSLLNDDGYKLSNVKEVIPPGGFPALLSMLPAGQVDAAWLPQPLGQMAQQQFGAVPIADLDQGSLQNFPFTGYIGSTPWVKAHPNTVTAFLRALMEGQQVADTDRSAVEQALEKYTGIKPIVAATMSIETYPLEIDVTQLQRVADAMFESGLTPGRKSPYQISQMIQPESGMIGKSK
jgi:NitT/TauT family transport system substrate-binding protein